ncbi:MAG: thymidine kinase [Holosporales bacterium]|jgi:thymidine kinase|nr:thymidine kinase [Holosporales bacterium]
MAKLIFTYGAMNAGKTTSLLQVAHNYEERGLKTAIFTYNDCDNNGSCFCRLGVSKKCTIFNKETDFMEVDLADASILLIDEAQFLTKQQVFDLGRITSLNDVPVMCFGLRTSWQGNVFEGSSALLGLADELREIRTICCCGKRATMAMKTQSTDNKSEEDIGHDKYVSLCRKCWLLSAKSGGVTL